MFKIRVLMPFAMGSCNGYAKLGFGHLERQHTT